MKKVLLLIVIIAAVLCSCPGNAQGNEFRIGVSLSLSTGGCPDFSSLRPWVQARIDGSTPNDVNLFRANEMHHGYVGLALLGLGKLLNKKSLRVIGGVLIIDDVMQHVLRVNSPVHMLSDNLYHYEWYRSLTNFGNKLTNQ